MSIAEISGVVMQAITDCCAGEAMSQGSLDRFTSETNKRYTESKRVRIPPDLIEMFEVFEGLQRS